MTALLDRAGGNVRRAAQAAGVSRTFLYDLMKRTLAADAVGEGPEDDG